MGYVPFAPGLKKAPGLMVGYADGIPILVLVLVLVLLDTAVMVFSARTSLDLGAVTVIVEVSTVVTVLQTGIHAFASAAEGLKKAPAVGGEEKAEGKMVMVSVTVLVPVVMVVVGSSVEAAWTWGLAAPAKIPAPGGPDIVTAGTKVV